MAKLIPLPTVGEILEEEFFKPLGLSTYRVAKDIRVPVSRVQEILKGKRRITPDTDLRLCKYLGMSNGFFLRLQMDLDIDSAIMCEDVADDLDLIPCITKDRIVSVE